MSRKVLILGAMAVLVCVSASSASAWTTNGPFGFSANTGSTRFTASPGPILNCTGLNGAVGTLFAKSSAASGLRLADLQQTFSGCTVSGLAFTVACTPLGSFFPLPAAFNGSSYSSPTTSGTISNISCVISIPNCSVTVTGTVSAQYDNTWREFRILPGGQVLRYAATGSSCTALGFAAFGWMDIGDVAGFTIYYRVASSPKPVITNP
jgi:hypothetical protein